MSPDELSKQEKLIPKKKNPSKDESSCLPANFEALITSGGTTPLPANLTGDFGTFSRDLPIHRGILRPLETHFVHLLDLLLPINSFGSIWVVPSPISQMPIDNLGDI